MSPYELFFAMIVWHALSDYPLQGEFLAKAKNRNMPIPGVPWYQAMTAHSLIHAGGVASLTGSLWLGSAEFFAHFAIDKLKCTGLISFNQDQFAHIACKVAWVACWIVMQ